MTAPVVMAPDSFKGTIGADAAASALAAGWRSVRPQTPILLRPMADGGEGTLDAFARAGVGAVRMPVRVTGPEDAPVDASWLLLPATDEAPGGTAVVELASTSGIELFGSTATLRPLHSHTRGFGEAICAALDHGVTRLVLGIGGSSSTDGGVGMLSALGGRFTDAGGAPVPAGGRGLLVLARADLSQVRPLPPGGVTVLTDVTSPLVGPHGAAAVFGPQKGASPLEVAALDMGLTLLAERMPGNAGAPGAGAAGGTGYGLLAWGARLVPGAAAVAEMIGLREAIATSSLVVTGEGSYDTQSAAGKVPSLVSVLAEAAGAPVALVAGRIAQGSATASFAATVSLSDLAGSPEAAMSDPARWLRAAGAVLARARG